MNLETKITIYKFTPQLFTLTPHGETDVMPLQGTLGEKKAAAFFAFQTGPYTDAYKNQKVGNKNAPI